MPASPIDGGTLPVVHLVRFRDHTDTPLTFAADWDRERFGWALDESRTALGRPGYDDLGGYESLHPDEREAAVEYFDAMAGLRDCLDDVDGMTDDDDDLLLAMYRSSLDKWWEALDSLLACVRVEAVNAGRRVSPVILRLLAEECRDQREAWIPYAIRVMRRTGLYAPGAWGSPGYGGYTGSAAFSNGFVSISEATA